MFKPIFLHCAIAAAQCIVTGPVCLCVGGCVYLFDCLCAFDYHDRSTLRASILTKLSL